MNNFTNSLLTKLFTDDVNSYASDDSHQTLLKRIQRTCYNIIFKNLKADRPHFTALQRRDSESHDKLIERIYKYNMVVCCLMKTMAKCATKHGGLRKDGSTSRRRCSVSATYNGRLASHGNTTYILLTFSLGINALFSLTISKNNVNDSSAEWRFDFMVTL